MEGKGRPVKGTKYSVGLIIKNPSTGEISRRIGVLTPRFSNYRQAASYLHGSLALLGLAREEYGWLTDVYLWDGGLYVFPTLIDGNKTVDEGGNPLGGIPEEALLVKMKGASKQPNLDGLVSTQEQPTSSPTQTRPQTIQN